MFQMKTFPLKNLKHFTFYISGHGEMRVESSDKKQKFLAEWSTIPFYKSVKEFQTTTNLSSGKVFSRVFENIKKKVFSFNSKRKMQNFSLSFNECQTREEKERKKKVATKSLFEKFHFRWLWKSFLTLSLCGWCDALLLTNGMRQGCKSFPKSSFIIRIELKRDFNWFWRLRWLCEPLTGYT